MTLVLDCRLEGFVSNGACSADAAPSRGRAKSVSSRAAESVPQNALFPLVDDSRRSTTPAAIDDACLCLRGPATLALARYPVVDESGVA